MSTTIKRVALVAVAALGLGVVTVAPSQAAVQNTALTVVDGTATTLKQDTTTAASITVSGLLDAGLADTITVSVIEKTVPGTSSNVKALLGYQETTTISSRVDDVARFATQLAQFDSVTVDTPGIMGISAATASYVGAKFTLQLRAGTGTIVAGTYTYTVIVKPVSNGVEGAAVSKDVSIVVTAPSTLADSTSLSVITSTTTDSKAYLDAYVAAGTATADSATVASKALSTIAANIFVKQKSAITTAVPAEAMIATITGPGTIRTASSVAGLSSATAGGRSISVAAGDYVGVYADGTSGIATITIVGTKSGVVLASKKVTFFDTTPASASATAAVNYVLAGTGSTPNTFLVVVKDAAGNPVTNVATLTGGPTDTSTAQVVGGAATCSTTYSTTKGGYLCSVVGLSATKFGKVNYTFVATGSDALATVVKATADVTFSSAVPATITITPASTTANPGAIVTYTLVAKDANGFAIADGDYNTNATPWFKTVTTSGFATAPFAKGDTLTVVDGVVTSDATLAIAGTATGSWTLVGSATAPTGTVVAKALEATVLKSADVAISNPGVDNAIEAANDAAQAASDATDAALAAADAADEATSKAQEAVDAVATLSAEVSKMITALKAQIKTLSNLVTKIAKKVKA
jgi:hypothetical protein